MTTAQSVTPPSTPPAGRASKSLPNRTVGGRVPRGGMGSYVHSTSEGASTVCGITGLKTEFVPHEQRLGTASVGTTLAAPEPPASAPKPKQPD